MAIAAAFAVVAAAVWTGRDNDKAEPLTTATGAVPYYLPAALPADLTLRSVDDHEVNDWLPSFSYFGDPRAANPFAKRDAVVSIRQRAAGESAPTARTGEKVTVRGHDGYINDEMAEPIRALALSFVEDANDIVVISKTLDRVALTAFAEVLIVNGTQVTVPATAVGLQLVTRDDAALTVPYTLGRGGGHALAYRDQSGATYTIEVNHGDAALLKASYWWGAEATKTRGHDAYRVHLANKSGDSGLDLTTYLWLEEPAVVIIARRTNGNDATLTSLVDALRRVSQSEWDDARATVQSARGSSSVAAPPQAVTTLATEPEVELASGTLNDIAWRVTMQGTVTCVRLTHTSAGQICMPSSAAPPGSTAGMPSRITPLPNNNTGKVILYGQADPSVTRVVIKLTDNTEHEGTIIARHPTDHSAYVLFVLDTAADSTARATMIAYRADGTAQTTGTVALGFPGQPTPPSTLTPNARPPTTA